MEITSLSFPLVGRRCVPPSNPKCSLLIGSAGHGVWRMEVAQQCVLCSSWQLRWDHARQRALIAEWRRSLPGWGLVGSSQRGMRTENGSSCVRKQRCAGNHQLLCSNGSCVGVEGVAAGWVGCGQLCCEVWVSRGCSSTAVWVLLALNGCSAVLGRNPGSALCSCGSRLPARHGWCYPEPVVSTHPSAECSDLRASAPLIALHPSLTGALHSLPGSGLVWAVLRFVPLLEGGFPPCLGVQSCSVTWLVLQPLSSCHSSAGALPAAAGGLQTCPTKLHLLPNYNRSGAPPGTPRAASF